MVINIVINKYCQQINQGRKKKKKTLTVRNLKRIYADIRYMAFIFLSKKKKSTWNQLTKLELHYMYACEAFKGQQHYPPWILSALSTYM